jgi:hypothetical protein
MIEKYFEDGGARDDPEMKIFAERKEEFWKWITEVVLKTTTWYQCYKTFSVLNLRIFVISWSVCPWQAFPA